MINGNRLRRLRVDNNLTTAELADKIGISKTMMIYVEQGKRTLGADALYRAAVALDVPMEELIKGAKARKAV